MGATKVLQNLAFVAMILEILHRAVIAIINAVRLIISPEYREEVFGSDTDTIEGVPA